MVAHNKTDARRERLSVRVICGTNKLRDGTVRVGRSIVHVPARATMVDARGDDTLRIELAIEDATATDTRTPGVERGEALGARHIARPYFVQMKGLMRIGGRVSGRLIGGEGAGFFETYR